MIENIIFHFHITMGSTIQNPIPNPFHIYRGRKSKSIFQNTTVNVKFNQLKQKEKVAIDLININIDYSTTSNSYEILYIQFYC